MNPNTPPLPAPHPKRKLILWGMTLGIFVIAILVFLYWFLWARFHEYTNDAYASGNLVYITPQIPGIVTAIHIDDTWPVEEGNLVIELDPTDATIALEESKAHLAEEIRNICELFFQAKRSLAQVEVAKAYFIRCCQDFERRSELVSSGGVSQEDFDHAETSLASAYFSLASEEIASLALLSQVEGTTVKNHPRVQKAAEEVKNAWVNLKRTCIYAPCKGMVAERTVQVGQHVKAGDPLCAVVPLDQMWIEANFKEVQLGHMQIGQKASYKSDIYGRSVWYEGNVIGIGAGTGSVFSILPPQNATGNWIKIVQRVPVRISIDPKQLAHHPLRLGLSMEVTVDVHDIGTSSVPSPLPSLPRLYETSIFTKEEEGADTLIEEIFTVNASYQDLCSSLSFESPDIP